MPGTTEEAKYLKVVHERVCARCPGIAFDAERSEDLYEALKRTVADDGDGVPGVRWQIYNENPSRSEWTDGSGFLLWADRNGWPQIGCPDSYALAVVVMANPKVSTNVMLHAVMDW